MGIKIAIKEGVWYDSETVKRKVKITFGYNHSGKKHFDVWYETTRAPFDVYGGYYATEYEAMDIIEKITGQKVQWHNTAKQFAEVRD